MKKESSGMIEYGTENAAKGLATFITSLTIGSRWGINAWCVRRFEFQEDWNFIQFTNIIYVHPSAMTAHTHIEMAMESHVESIKILSSSKTPVGPKLSSRSVNKCCAFRCFYLFKWDSHNFCLKSAKYA